MSPPGRPKGEYRSAQHAGSAATPPGRPKGEYRSAQHAGSAATPPGRPKGEYRSAQHAGSAASAPLRWLATLGARTLRVLQNWGHGSLFFVALLRVLPQALRRFGLVLVQVHAIGNRSLLIILASGLAVGFVLALQMYYALAIYGAAESLGLVVNLTLVRELGPVVTALLFAGRAGTSLTAEIGLMKAGEQLAAMELMAIDPRARVLAPRFLAGVLSMPLLAALFSAIGILGAWVVGVGLIGIDSGNFWSIQQYGVDVWRDVGNGLIKSVVFGVICTFIALYQGFEAEATPQGVAHATTRTVVLSSLAVLGSDFILTALMFSTR